MGGTAAMTNSMSGAPMVTTPMACAPMAGNAPMVGTAPTPAIALGDGPATASTAPVSHQADATAAGVATQASASHVNGTAPAESAAPTNGTEPEASSIASSIAPAEETKRPEAQSAAQPAAQSEAQPASQAAPELPAGWEQGVDPNTSKIYYYNRGTGQSSWTIPTA